MKKRFREYKDTIREIEYLEDKLAEVEARATRMTPVLSDEPRGGNSDPDKLTDLVADMIEYKEKINKLLGKAYKYARETEAIIEELEPHERSIMRLRYIECKSWLEITKLTTRDRSSAFRIHDFAMGKLEGQKSRLLGT